MIYRLFCLHRTVVVNNIYLCEENRQTHTPTPTVLRFSSLSGCTSSTTAGTFSCVEQTADQVPQLPPGYITISRPVIQCLDVGHSNNNKQRQVWGMVHECPAVCTGVDYSSSSKAATTRPRVALAPRRLSFTSKSQNLKISKSRWELTSCTDIIIV